MSKHSSLYRKRPLNGRRKQKRFRSGKTRKTYKKIKSSFQISIFNYCFTKGINTLKFERPLFLGGNHQFAHQIISNLTTVSEGDRSLMKLLYDNGKSWEEIIDVVNDLNAWRDTHQSNKTDTQILRLVEELIRSELSAEGRDAIRQWLKQSES